MTPFLKSKIEQYEEGVRIATEFCNLNGVRLPTFKRLERTEKLFHLATCAFYRPYTINVMVEKCASLGFGGRAWSWPGWCVDRTPYGVVQHELGHHVDEDYCNHKGVALSQVVYEASKEEPMTGYLGKDNKQKTFYMEWFAEIFRVFITNPDLCKRLRPKFYAAMRKERYIPLPLPSWDVTLYELYCAPERITEQAKKRLGLIGGELI